MNKGLLAIIVAVVMAVISCRPEQKHREISDEDTLTPADSIIFAVADTRDVPRTLAVIDSLEQAGELSYLRTIFHRTVAYNLRGEYRQSMNLYYKLADIDLKTLDDQGDYECYIYSNKDYLRLLCDMKRYDVALREAYAIDRKLKEVGDNTFASHHDIAEIIGECQLYLGNTADAARSFQKSLNNIHQRLNSHQAPLDFRECQHTMKSVAMAYIHAGDYAKAAPWVERQDSLFSIACIRSDRDTTYIDEMKSDISYCRALLELARGGKKAAERAYRDYLSTRSSKSLASIINSSEYLMMTRRYNEAADNYNLLGQFLQETAFEVDLENIGRYLLPKYRANLLAGRRDSALSVATVIAEAYDSALTRQKRSDAALLATVYDTEGKERLMAEQRSELSQQRLLTTGIVLLLIVIFFVVYTIHRRKVFDKLNATNRLLTAANKRAEELQQTKADMMKRMCDELRSPLSVLTGCSQVLANPDIELDSEERQSVSKMVAENAKRISQVVDELQAT